MRGNLPVPLTRIVGRDDIISALAAQLAQRRFLTVVGPGGIGKNTIAVAVAEKVSTSYEDGVWFVGLAPLPVHTAQSSVGDAQALNQPVTLCFASAEAGCPVALFTGDLAAAALARILWLQGFPDEAWRRSRVTGAMKL